jgi:DNA-binding NarL/FixJ family response regulator
MFRREAFGPCMQVSESLTGHGASELSAEAESALVCRPPKPRKLTSILALIDPRSLTRHATLSMLTTAFPGHEVIATATCEELFAYQNGSAGTPSSVILNVRRGGLDDVAVNEALLMLRNRLPQTPIIAVSDREEADDLAKMLALGLRGYIPTSTEPDIAFAAMRLVIAGGVFIPPRLRSSVPGRRGDGAPAASANGEGAPRKAPGFTPRELCVIGLLREGRPNKLIASELRIQESTVKVHVRNIMKKLNAANRTQAAFLANRLLETLAMVACAAMPGAA